MAKSKANQIISNRLKPDRKWLLAFRKALLSWYQNHQRDLPWRRSDDPYAIWIAEIMLQQTQVEQALPYYQRFMARFPSLATLAQAPLPEVLKLWEGLGYYARVRHLHQAAQEIVAKQGGRIPDRLEALSALPGIGAYTAAAILSIAYGQDHAVVDGNVTRVLCRLFCLAGDVTKAATKRILATLAKRLLKKGHAAAFNQAMMELGSTVCTPRQPHCGSCPVNSLCRARTRLLDPTLLPHRPSRKPRPHYDVTAGIIWWNGRLLIARRPLQGLLGGLWEFPGGTRLPEESLPGCLVREVAAEVGVQVVVDRLLAAVSHAYTHFEITLHGFHCTYTGGQARPLSCSDCRWVTLEELDHYAFSRAHKRLIEALHEETKRRQLRLFEDLS